MKRKKQVVGAVCAVLVSLFVPATGFAAYGSEISAEESAPSFQTERFVLPDTAGLLVVVEGTEGCKGNVYVYEKSSFGVWEQKFVTPGYFGENGMSSNRREGDKTTPIGLFRLNTPFGQKPALKGFPADYIQVETSDVWTEAENRLIRGASGAGERVGSSGYSEYYDYCLDMGYNRNAIEKKGSALFLHCIGHERYKTSGCVAIERERMEEIMKLYGAYGEEGSFVALAPAGTFEYVYDSLGVNRGLSPDGEFGV